MAHGNAVIYGNGVELHAVTAVLVDHFLDLLADGMQMHVPRYELGKGVGNGDDGLLEVLGLHAGGAPQGSRAGHAPPLRGGTAAK